MPLYEPPRDSIWALNSIKWISGWWNRICSSRWLTPPVHFPSDDAPAIADLHGRIVARGPYLEAEPQLYEDGWVHGCTQAEGCGFAREQHVRSPIDWRAIFTQTGSGAPWVLETYVAGD